MRLVSFTKALTIVGGVFFTLSAQATLLDFSGLPDGLNATPLYVPGTGGGTGATITGAAGFAYVGAGAAGAADGFCFVDNQVSNCEFDGEMVFDNVINSLLFDIDGAQAGDSVDISAYNGAALLGMLNFTADGPADFSGFGDITRLVFDDNSTAAGVGYSTFSFNGGDRNPVPAPATLALFGLGLLGLGWSRRQKA